MRQFIEATLLFCVMPITAVSCELTWASAEIPIPAQVRSFISSECRAARDSSEETVEECISAEGYGYRATVTLLTDPLVGDSAVHRYRVCSGGLSTEGGRFHRRKAECTGLPMGLVWRFDRTEETRFHPTGLKPHTRFAYLDTAHDD